MEISRKAAAVLTMMALVVAACNSDSEPTGEPVATEAPTTIAATTTEAPTASAVTTTTAAAEADTTNAEAEDASAEVLLAYRTVFDSRIPFDEKSHT